MKSYLSVFTLVAVIMLTASISAVSEHYLRSHKQYEAFRIGNPCPSTGKTEGRCPGYQVDHIIALELGGEDSYTNMQWLSEQQHYLKTQEDNRKAHALRQQQ